VWLDQRMGPLNLWRVLRERDGTLTPTIIVQRHEAGTMSREERAANVVQVARDELTGWFEGSAYLFGGDVVIEYLGSNGGQT
ncbi:MAG: hypothetical protein GWO39_00410, partial [Gammaproteobacteria bacterium]|nr:hypothetical protein [Gammaproteobacteria bacterium]NIT62308.1 hypothetical protein [Gammaproteobacteria bacterium]NIV19222.1 hypothetical protein [Gammaproteobacteria bacterium]NIY30888.1 hypothetical protein [Gammaproteobacteria bacterium]